MAHPVKKLGSGAKKYVAASSRYVNANVIQYGEQSYITFETYKRRRHVPSEDDQWLEITKAVEYRPDLVSTEIYGAPDFWWRILEYNGMKDVLEFKAGKNIRISGDVWQ